MLDSFVGVTRNIELGFVIGSHVIHEAVKATQSTRTRGIENRHKRSYPYLSTFRAKVVSPLQESKISRR